MSDEQKAKKAQIEWIKVQSMDLENPIYTHLHIAKLLTYTVKHVADHVIKSDGFPAARRPTIGTKDILMHKTYEREAVMDWYLRQPFVEEKSA